MADRGGTFVRTGISHSESIIVVWKRLEYTIRMEKRLQTASIRGFTAIDADAVGYAASSSRSPGGMEIRLGRRRLKIDRSGTFASRAT
jgi:hypothetical protein